MKIANKAETKKKRGNPNWKKGGPSPNPTGRPHDTLTPHLREIAATGAGREVAERLYAEALGGNVQAIAILLDRLDGKPKQTLDVNIDERRNAIEKAVSALMQAHNVTREEALETMLEVYPEAREWIN